jgi:hypothetical protein
LPAGKSGTNFRGHDEFDLSLCIYRFLQLLKDYDHLLNDHLQSDTVFKGTSLALQNSVYELTLDEISKQIQEAPYVLVTLDETSDIQMVAQLATVLRYILGGKIQERFVGSLTEGLMVFSVMYRM